MWGRTFQLTVLCYTVFITVLLLAVHECMEQTVEVEPENPDVVKGKLQGKVSSLETCILHQANKTLLSFNLLFFYLHQLMNSCISR